MSAGRLASGTTLIRAVLCALLLVCTCGCTASRELRDLAIVVGMGVDLGDTPDTLSLTAQIVRPEQIKKSTGGTSQGGGSTAPFWNAESTGETVFDAARLMTQKTGKRLFVSHSQVLVFGSDVAARGLRQYIDFFLRAHEMRPATPVFVAQGSASTVLNTLSEIESQPATAIAELGKGHGWTSQSRRVRLHDLASWLLTKTIAPVLPLVRVSDDGGKPILEVSGLAVLKGDKMIGTLDLTESRGLLWVTNQVRSGVFIVPTPGGGGKATLEITGVKTSVAPKVVEGRVRIDISIKVDGSLAEQTSIDNMATPERLASLEQEMAERIRQEISAAFERSKELQADIFGFGEMVHQRYLPYWRQAEVKWDSIYPSIELVLSVAAKIRKTDVLIRPAAPDGGEGR